MKAVLAIVSTLVFTGSVIAQAAVSSAKAIELSAHRVDRLVALSKIDASFQKKLSKIEVTVVQNQAPVAFKTVVTQSQPAQGKPMQLEISLDADGKALAHKLISGGVAGPDLGFSGKSAGELAENALHYVLDNVANGKIALFDKAATNFTLTKVTYQGETVALGQLRSSATTEKLNVYVKLDGKFLAAEVVP